MARKSKLRRRSVAERNLLEIASRELSKGNAKLALKHARVCHRKAPTAQTQHVLQRALTARIDQLNGTGLEHEARQLWHELSQTGDVAPELRAEVARLGALLGLTACRNGAADSPAGEGDPRLDSLLADQAILDPSKANRCPPAVLEDVEIVRRTLEAIEQDDLQGAQAALAAIQRGSPCAEWKLFARGLMGYYADDSDRMLANWSRLDPRRPTHRIAETLLVVGGHRGRDSASPTTLLSLDRLLRYSGDSAIVFDLRRLVTAWRQRNWSGVQRDYRQLVQAHAGTDAATIARVTDVLWREMVREGRYEQFDKFSKHAPPPPLDPYWNRARALLVEENRHAPLDLVEVAWNAYAEDLNSVTCLDPQQRRTAVALVMCHLGRQFVEAANDEKSPFTVHADQPYIRRLHRAAARYFARSLEYDSSLRNVYTEYARVLTNLRQPKRANRLHLALFERFPHDFDAAMTVAEYFLGQENYDLAKRAARRAFQLRARDVKARVALWNACLRSAHMAAVAGKFTAAREELDEAAPLAGQASQASALEACRAAVEFRARNMDRARQHVEAARRSFDQPVVGLLMVGVQACRFGVDRSVRSELNSQLAREMEREGTSPSAGAVSAFIESLLADGVTYREFKTHERGVVKYLSRCQSVDWQCDDLIAACALLGRLRNCRSLFKKLVQAGLRRFPEEPHFPYFAGFLEFQMRPHGRRLARVRASLDSALELATRHGRPLREDFQGLAQRIVGFLTTARDVMPNVFDP